MNDYLNSFRLRNQEKLNLGQMDSKHLELSSLFEFSQTLNSSLDLKTILDNLLFMPMGRMMVSKGMILLTSTDSQCTIATVKGLDHSLINKQFIFKNKPQNVIIIKSDEDYKKLPDIFSEYKLKLIIPIKLMNKIMGIMALGPKMLQKEFTDDETHYLSSIGNIAAPAIENAQVFKELNFANHQLDQKIQELNTLFEIGNELNRVFEPDEILKRLSFSLMGQMMINQFFVAVLDSNQQLSIVYKKGARFKDDLISMCIGAPLPLSKKAVLITEMENQEFENLKKAGVKVIVPMVIQEAIKGYIFLGEKPNKFVYNQSDCEFLSTLANLTIISLENARLFQETLEKQKLEEELNLAHAIQSKLLPSHMPQIEGYDLSGFNIPSKHVGGDYYDIIMVNEKEYIFTIADVSGKGMPASLLMSNLQAGLHTLYSENYSLSEITFKLNNLIYRNTSVEKYITFFISKINLQDNTLQFVNAGHNPPYLFNSDSTYTELSKGGIILGMMENMPYETGELSFDINCILTMFTDGVTEAMSPGDIPFDEFRVIDFFRKNLKTKTCELINKNLIEELFNFAGDPTKDDDITILTIRRNK